MSRVGWDAAAAVLSGLLLVWALPPGPRPLVAAVALVPLAVAVVRRPAGEGDGGGSGGAGGRGVGVVGVVGRAGSYRAWRLGAVAGAVAWALLLRWIVPSLAALHPLALAIAVWGAVVALLAGLTGLAGLLLHRLHHRHGLPLVLALPVAWAGVEWLRAHLGPLAFPWLELGAALTDHPSLMAPAEWSGARGLSFWLAAVGGGGADLVLRLRRRASAGRSRDVPSAGAPLRGLPLPGVLPAALALVLVLPGAWGAWRVRTLALEPGPRVAVVATDLSLRGDAPAARTAAAVRAVRRLLDGAGGMDAPNLDAPDLIVLPEAVVRLPGAEGDEALAELARLARRTGAPLVVGAYLDGTEAYLDGPETYLDLPEPSSAPANGALLLLPEGGVAGAYEKRRLVPGLERVPFLAPERSGGFRAGRDGALLEVGPSLSVGVLVCFESLFGPLARAYRSAGADVLVALTDDAWLAAGGSAGPGALEQHAAQLALRAAESRVGVVRSANRGWSGAVDPLGRRIGVGLAPGEEGVVRARIPRTGVRTAYVRWGDWVGGGSALLCLIAAAIALGESRSRPRER